MRIGRNEIVEELTEHMRKVGGEAGEWCVGTAENDGGLKIQDSTGNPDMNGLAHREAHTAYAAAEALEYLVDAFGVRRSPASKPGRTVFVHRTARGT